MLLKINIIMAVVGLSLCATWRAKHPEIPEKFAGEEGCYIEEIDQVVGFGVKLVAPVGHCYSITCDTEYIIYASCGTIAVNEPNCYVTEVDLTKPHPQCCPHVQCDSENKV